MIISNQKTLLIVNFSNNNEAAGAFNCKTPILT